MEKNIWVLSKNKQELILIQKYINAKGAMRTFCMLSADAVKKNIEQGRTSRDAFNRPSCILYDYVEQKEEDFLGYHLLQQESKFAGVPFAFFIEKEEQEEECYNLGAAMVIPKPVDDKNIRRVERLAWQYEQTRVYENVLQRQATELAMARKIKELNVQLEARNELLHKLFDRYFSSKIVDVILSDPKGASIGGEKKQVVVMLADLRGFTSLSEHVEADVITDIINHFLEKMTELIFGCQGSIIEFIGDAILAVFGAPVDSGHACEDAVVAAIRMQNAMEDVNKYNELQGYPLVQMGIGLHLGEVFIGNIGSEKMMRYNIIGKTVNQCSRIESCSIGGQILASKPVLQELENKLLLGKSSQVEVKGVNEVIEIQEIYGIQGENSCRLEHMEEEIFKPLELPKECTLFLVIEKQVTESGFRGIMKEKSEHRIRMELLGRRTLPLYADVECVIDRRRRFAKVIRSEGSQIELHFNQRIEVEE